MYPIKLVKVVWQTKEERFYCIAEEGIYRFNLESDIGALTDDLDIVQAAKQLGWDGFDKIYRL